MLTPSQQNTLYKRITETILELKPDDPMLKALELKGFNEYYPLLGMTSDDINSLDYPDKDDQGNVQMKTLNWPQCNQLIVFTLSTEI